jgi:parvulin-like peptidyl-prolyl isomerase
VASVNGQKVTAAQALKLLQAMPAADLQRLQQNGGGLPNALTQIFMMQHLADVAAQQHLDQQEAVKSQLDFLRQNVLAQAYIAKVGDATNPTPADLRSYYDQHPQEFQEVKLSAIVVNFTPAGAPAQPGQSGAAKTDAEAKAKADDLVKKIRAGSNFADLAKTDSDYKASADKGGQMGTYSPEKLPKEIGTAVMKLKDGEITDPIREASGYYILKLDGTSKKTFEQAQNDIVAQLKNAEVRKVLDQTNQQYQVQVQDGDFFNLPGTTGAATSPSLARPNPGQPKTTATK